ncbi:MAG: hypothetical protein RIC95_09170 [Vicingaceae bacterium]
MSDYQSIAYYDGLNKYTTSFLYKTAIKKGQTAKKEERMGKIQYCFRKV